MGDRGPAPRREAERRRTNDKGKAKTLTQAQLQEFPFEIDYTPDPDAAPGHWTSVISDLWDALKVDPCRTWMTSADWATTKLVFEVTNQQMTSEDKDGNLIGVNGAQQSAVLKHLANIGVTEAARLRLQKEVTLFPTQPRDTEGNVVDIATARHDEVN